MPRLSDLPANKPFPLSTTSNWQLVHALDTQGRMTTGRQLIDITAEFTGNAKNPSGLRVTDNAMQSAGICQNAIVVIDQTRAPKDDQIVVAQLGDQVFCRRLRQDQQGARLTTDSANWPDLALADNPGIQILGVVVSVVTQYVAW